MIIISLIFDYLFYWFHFRFLSFFLYFLMLIYFAIIVAIDAVSLIIFIFMFYFLFATLSSSFIIFFAAFRFRHFMLMLMLVDAIAWFSLLRFISYVIFITMLFAVDYLFFAAACYYWYFIMPFILFYLLFSDYLLDTILLPLIYYYAGFASIDFRFSPLRFISAAIFRFSMLFLRRHFSSPFAAYFLRHADDYIVYFLLHLSYFHAERCRFYMLCRYAPCHAALYALILPLFFSPTLIFSALPFSFSISPMLCWFSDYFLPLLFLRWLLDIFAMPLWYLPPLRLFSLLPLLLLSFVDISPFLRHADAFDITLPLIHYDCCIVWCRRLLSPFHYCLMRPPLFLPYATYICRYATCRAPLRYIAHAAVMPPAIRFMNVAACCAWLRYMPLYSCHFAAYWLFRRRCITFDWLLLSDYFSLRFHAFALFRFLSFCRCRYAPCHAMPFAAALLMRLCWCCFRWCFNISRYAATVRHCHADADIWCWCRFLLLLYFIAIIFDAIIAIFRRWFLIFDIFACHWLLLPLFSPFSLLIIFAFFHFLWYCCHASMLEGMFAHDMLISLCCCAISPLIAAATPPYFLRLIRRRRCLPLFFADYCCLRFSSISLLLLRRCHDFRHWLTPDAAADFQIHFAASVYLAAIIFAFADDFAAAFMPYCDSFRLIAFFRLITFRAIDYFRWFLFFWFSCHYLMPFLRFFSVYFDYWYFLLHIDATLWFFYAFCFRRFSYFHFFFSLIFFDAYFLLYFSSLILFFFAFFADYFYWCRRRHAIFAIALPTIIFHYASFRLLLVSRAFILCCWCDMPRAYASMPRLRCCHYAATHCFRAAIAAIIAVDTISHYAIFISLFDDAQLFLRCFLINVRCRFDFRRRQRSWFFSLIFTSFHAPSFFAFDSLPLISFDITLSLMYLLLLIALLSMPLFSVDIISIYWCRWLIFSSFRRWCHYFRHFRFFDFFFFLHFSLMPCFSQIFSLYAFIFHFSYCLCFSLLCHAMMIIFIPYFAMPPPKLLLLVFREGYAIDAADYFFARFTPRRQPAADVWFRCQLCRSRIHTPIFSCCYACCQQAHVFLRYAFRCFTPRPYYIYCRRLCAWCRFDATPFSRWWLRSSGCRFRYFR